MQSAAERWFLRHGLPTVLSRRARWTELWPRSAPAFAGFAAWQVTLLVMWALIGEARYDVYDDPTVTEWFVVVVLLLMIPVSVLVGWFVSRLPTRKSRSVASTVSIVVAVVAETVHSGWGLAVTACFGAVVVLLLTASGVGSIVAWAMRLTVTQLSAIGALMLRALPVVLLTVLVFFNQPVWDMATRLSPTRMWMAMLFLVLIAGVFLISGTIERAKPVLHSAAPTPGHITRLNETPFKDMADPEEIPPLTLGERVNVVFVLGVSQLVQVATVAIVTALIFLSLGLIVVSPALLQKWTGNGLDSGAVLGLALPIPQALINVAMFLGALTFMYISARAVDGEYRSHFLDPLIDDLTVTMVARSRYRELRRRRERRERHVDTPPLPGPPPLPSGAPPLPPVPLAAPSTPTPPLPAQPTEL